MSEPLFENIERSNLSRAFMFPLNFGIGVADALYFGAITQVSVTADSEIQISLAQPKDVFSIFATHLPTVDLTARTVTCAANSLVPVAIHSAADGLHAAWSILGAAQIVYTIEDGAILDSAGAGSSNRIAESVTRFRFKFVDRSGQVIPDPVRTLRAISRFNMLFRAFLLYCVVLNDPRSDSTRNKFQVSQGLIDGWPPAWSIKKILADEWLMWTTSFRTEMGLLGADVTAIYSDALTDIGVSGFRDLTQVSDLASFESHLSDGVAAYVHSPQQRYYIVVYDAAIYSVDLIQVAPESNVLDTVAQLANYTTIINGPLFVNRQLALHVGARKFAATPRFMPPVLPPTGSEWNVVFDAEQAVRGKLIVDDDGTIHILAGDLTADELQACWCGSDSLPLVVENHRNNFAPFKSFMGWTITSFNGLSAPFIGDFTKDGHRYFFVLVKENQARSTPGFSDDSFPVYQAIFDALDAANVVSTDGSDSAAIFHVDFSRGPFSGSYSELGRSKIDNMPALFGVQRRLV